MQPALAGVPLESVDVLFTSHQDAQPRPAGQVAYPRNLRHVRAGDERFQIIRDVPREAGGFDLGPTVEEHQPGVMGTCLTHIFEIQAAQRHVVLDTLEVHVEGTLTPRVPGGAPSRLRDVQYTVHIGSPAPAAEIDALRQAVEAVCPIYNLVKEPQGITGRVVRGRAQSLRAPLAPDAPAVAAAGQAR